MSIGTITIGTRKCVLVGGKPSGKTRMKLSFRVSKKYRLQLLMDGKPFGGYKWTVNKRYKFHKDGSREEIDTEVWVDVPSDGRNHDIALKDLDSNEQSSATSFISINCAGGVVPDLESLVEDPATGDKRYTISLRHDGQLNKTLTGYVWLNGKQVGGSIPLKPKQTAKREVVIPATGQQYTITTGWAYGKTMVYRTMWVVVDANDPPITDPAQWTSTTTFDPGETVVVSSAVGEVPLATDGSEWIFLEYSTNPGNVFVPFGDDGLVEPDDDGTWSYEIETGSGTPFTADTSWQVRATRYKNYRASESVVHTFSIGPTPKTATAPLKAPVITGPKNKRAKSGSRVYLTGTGPPGARLYFESRRLTAWGTAGPAPKSCTVGKNGKWKTWVSSKHYDKKHKYKRVGYSCRAKLNGRYSGYSNELSVRWDRKK